MAAVLVALNVFNLDALAHIASAVFLISYLAVQVAHWRLIQADPGLALHGRYRLLCHGAVFIYFLWSTAMAQPWSVAVIAVFIACSWAIEMFLDPRRVRHHPLARSLSSNE